MNTRGFTLLEVLIALAILAIAVTAVIAQTGTSLYQLERLQQKNTALWIADNQVAYLRSTPQWPTTGHRSETLSLAGQEWQIDTEIESTSEPWLRKIEIEVGLKDSDTTLVSVSAFRGRY